MQALIMIFSGNDGSVGLPTSQHSIGSSFDVWLQQLFLPSVALQILNNLALRTWRNDFLGRMLSSLQTNGRKYLEKNCLFFSSAVTHNCKSSFYPSIDQFYIQGKFMFSETVFINPKIRKIVSAIVVYSSLAAAIAFLGFLLIFFENPQ